ncbi:MAG: DNA polymerase III subunit beta [Myxococcales bacterium]|nr:DNA polymerase III subunit beta [Myxococcales bacterium]
MHLTIDKTTLVTALSKVQSVVERRNTLPILSNVLLTARKGELELTATDLEVGLRGLYAAKVSEPGRIALNARKIFDVVREMPDGPLGLELKDNHWVEVTAGKARFSLVGLDPEKFPPLPIPEDLKVFKISAAILGDLIDKTAFCASTDEARVNLNGVLLERAEQNGEPCLRMVATDGHRLALRDHLITPDRTVNFEGRVLIPRKGVSELKKLVDEAQGELEIGFSENSCVVTHDRQTLVIRLIDKEFPDYNQVIPDEGVREIEVGVEALRDALRRVSVLATDKTKAVKFVFAGDTLTLSSTNTDMEEGTEEIAINYGGASLAVGFNAKYLLEFLGTVGDEHLTLELNDELSPGLARPLADPRFLYVIMPMRIAAGAGA